MNIALGKHRNISTNRDWELSIFICIYIIFDSVNSTIQVTSDINSSLLLIFKIIMAAIEIVLLVYAVNHMRIKDVSIFFLCEIVGIFACIYSLLVEASGNNVLELADTMLIRCIPIGVSVYLISDKQILYKLLLKISWVLLALTVINFFFSTVYYDMHFSYVALLIGLLHLSEWINNKRKIYYLFFSIFELFMMVIHGSRGALLCVAAFIIIKLIFSKYSLNKRISAIGITVLIFPLIYVLVKELSEQLYLLLLRIGVTSRTVNLIFSKSFFLHDSGRIDIWKKTLELIKQRPLGGWGIGGAISQLSEVAEKNAHYPHQLFLDLFLSFGMIFGMMILLLILFVLIKAFRSKENQDIYHIFFSVAFVSLMFSGTLFTNIYFSIMMGLAFSIVIKKNYKVIGGQQVE